MALLLSLAANVYVKSSFPFRLLSVADTGGCVPDTFFWEPNRGCAARHSARLKGSLDRFARYGAAENDAPNSWVIAGLNGVDEWFDPGILSDVGDADSGNCRVADIVGDGDELVDLNPILRLQDAPDDRTPVNSAGIGEGDGENLDDSNDVILTGDRSFTCDRVSPAGRVAASLNDLGLLVEFVR